MYHNIAVSGGGVSALVFVGCIKKFREHRKTFTFDNFIGSSSGSIVCLFMILDYTYDEVRTFLSNNLIDSPVSMKERMLSSS
jgi:predicted acylesterase/phospholipase RssA